MDTTAEPIVAMAGPHTAAGDRPQAGADLAAGDPPQADLAAGDPPPDRPLVGIGVAATRVGVSERALRYYQQLGLLVPACTTPGGLRRYSEDDIARVARIRELQNLLGLNLDEIAIVLRSDDRMAEIRRTYHDERTSDAERRRLTSECIALQENLRGTVEAKRAALDSFLADVQARITRARELLAEGDQQDLRSGAG
jgi:DNA-binding transcriptional MerR regulator